MTVMVALISTIKCFGFMEGENLFKDCVRIGHRDLAEKSEKEMKIKIL